MAIREELVLDLSQALSQLDDLERQLDALIQPITIPVEVEAGQGLKQLESDAGRAEDEFEDLRREVDRTDDGLEKVERQAKKTGDDLERAGKKGKKSFSSLTKGVLAFGAALGGIAALRALGGFFADSITAASDLEESVSKAGVVFGEFFDDIEEFTETAPEDLGLATAAALEMTGTFGNLFVALGLSQEAAADLAPDIVQLGADLASFNNLEVTDALDKLRAGLVGEAEPLRALGVNLTAATTLTKALELGLVDANGVVTEAGKVQARYALILEQTTTAQGDFARTSDGLANRQRTLAGEFENVKAAVGQALVPAYEAILDLAPAVIEAIEVGLVPALESLSAAAGSVDTKALAIDLAQLPSAISSVFGDIKAGAEGLGNLAQAVDALVRLDLIDFFDQLAQATEDFDSIAARGTARQAIQNLIVTLGEGAAPADALESVLVELGETVSNLDLEQFEALVDQLLAITDLSDLDIHNLVALIRESGQAAGFSAEGVEILVAALLEGRSAGEALSPVLAELAEKGPRVRKAAVRAAGGIDKVTVAFEELRKARIDDVIADLETQFDALPDALDAAADALRDVEGEIVEDFTKFLDNLDAELEARAAFASNIAFLRALGLDDLAAVFTQVGLDAASALADAVANPDEAREAERKLEEFARAEATAFKRAFLAELTGLGITLPVEVVLGELTEKVPRVIIDEELPTDPRAAAADTLIPPVTVNQFFDNTPSPTTETERAAQLIAGLVE